MFDHFETEIQIEETFEYLTQEQLAELHEEMPIDIPDLEPYDLKTRIENCQTGAREMLLELYNEMAQLIEIPNSLLRDEFQTKKTTGRSVAELERMFLRKNDENPAIEKKIRLDSYCDQEHDENNALRYCEDERRLNNAQIRFVNMMVRLGVIEADDLKS